MHATRPFITSPPKYIGLLLRFLPLSYRPTCCRFLFQTHYSLRSCWGNYLRPSLPEKLRRSVAWLKWRPSQRTSEFQVDTEQGEIRELRREERKNKCRGVVSRNRPRPKCCASYRVELSPTNPVRQKPAETWPSLKANKSSPGLS